MMEPKNHPMINGEIENVTEDTQSNSQGNQKRQCLSDSDSEPTESKTFKMSGDETPKLPEPFGHISATSVRMMKQMGYKEGSGLGKMGQGRVAPIETSSQKGRSGLGMKLNELDTAADQWDYVEEKLQIPEDVTWLVNTNADSGPGVTREQLDSWIIVGQRKMTIDNEHTYCDQNILLQILQSKSVFDNLGVDDMRKARSKANPFELIKSNVFINRAAVKMANMDSLYDYMFTNPVDKDGKQVVKDQDLLYFADVCAGPGGFSEYILFRKNWHAKGFGFTLRGANDFRLDEFSAGSPETFDPYYGPKDDGNIFDPANIDGFTAFVMKQTETGVHFMMADGGFSVDGQENLQEILSKQLYLCQVIVALGIVRTGGHFVMKLFDLFTPFSVGLVYLMYKCFSQISICKPNSSRPANSERYLVCKWKLRNTDDIKRHLQDVNKQMFQNRNDSIDTLALVSDDVMREDRAFFEYLYNSNNTIGRNQIAALLKIAAFCKNRELTDPRQIELKQRCLELWDLRDSIRKFPGKGDPDKFVTMFYREWSCLTKEVCLVEKLVQPDLRCSFPSAYDWHFVPIANNDSICTDRYNIRAILLGKGGKEVYRFDPKPCTWIPLKNIAVELPQGTIIYAEVVRELQGEGKSQIIINTLHIIDGLVLGGEDIRKLPLLQRMAKCQQFAKALHKPLKGITDSSNAALTIQVRAKKLYNFFEIEHFFCSLRNYELKTGPPRPGYVVRNSIDTDRFYVPRGLLFLKEVKPDYLKSLSKKTKLFYYYHTKTKNATYEQDIENAKLETMANFEETFRSRLLWKWEMVQQVVPNYTGEDKSANSVYRSDFKTYLEKNYTPT